ncbi:MAG: hypothetical protein WCQ90_10515 [Deltaproteobacteria bacterium]
MDSKAIDTAVVRDQDGLATQSQRDCPNHMTGSPSSPDIYPNSFASS